MAAFQKVATMYIKYIQIFRSLEECYDQVQCNMIYDSILGFTNNILT